MADVFISYAREDRLAAERIAAALGRYGWSAWWDSDIPPGQTWDEMIERELRSASCTVVLWSATSLGRAWVKSEAADALSRGVLVPVMLENVTPPLAFRHIQAVPLMDWRNTLEHAGFQQLLCSICALAGLPARPEADDAGRAFRTGRMKAKGAVVSAQAGQKATLCVAPLAPAGRPADEVRAAPPPPRSEAPAKREIEAPPAGRAQWLRRALASGGLALAAATFGYGINDAVDWWLAPPALLAGDHPSSDAAAAPACGEGAVTTAPVASPALPIKAALR